MGQHEHDHPHAPITDGGEPAAAARARALEELLVEKEVIRREDVRRGIDWLVSRSPADGARLVARAWVDAEFKERLRVWTADIRYLVIPRRPGGSDGLSEEELAALVTRDSMIGVAQPAGPA